MKKSLLLVGLLLLTSLIANAATFNVNCDRTGPGGKISTYLKLANAFDATTIRVSGTCHENIQINSLDRLSLIAVAGATLQDASSGAQPVILITDSRRVTVQGFTITGGDTGISCLNKSLCRLYSNTSSGASSSGIFIDDSEANLWNDKLQDNGGNGLTIDGSKVTASELTVTGTNGFGLNIANSSSLALDGADIESNQAGGIFLVAHSGLNLLNATISQNPSAGIVVLWNSSMATYQVTVTNNTANGVYVEGNSTVDLFGGGTYTGNNLGGPDIFCGSHSGIAVNLNRVTYGITNCN
jgi:parallel beta helix pectate lyase-like protein